MKRFATVLAGFCLVVLADGPTALAQQTLASKVRYYLKGKEESVTGPIVEETLEAVTVKGTPNKKIPAHEVIDVEYPSPNPKLTNDLRIARNSELEKKYEDALKQYEALLPKFTDVRLKRHTEFKIACMYVKLAATDNKQVRPAIDQLLKFKKTYPDAWQLLGFLKLLIPLQIKNNDLDGAQKTLDDLAALPKAPADFRQQCELMGVDLMIRSKKFPEAEKRLQEMLKALPAADPRVPQMKARLAECYTANKKFPEAEKELRSVIDTASTPEAKALAYNTLGDYNQQNGNPREAMWNYLFVHILYNQNKEEHARSLYNLYKVSKELKDDKKAQLYRSILEKDKQFAGRYQELIQKEK